MVIRNTILALFAASFAASCPAAAFAERPAVKQPSQAARPAPRQYINWKMTTFGGKQFWADYLVQRGWRIQRNVFTGHFRLLDPANVRHAWGSWETCRRKFDKLRRERGLRPVTGKVVVLMHGLFRSRNSMQALADYFERSGQFTAICVAYPSSRAALSEHARGLASVIEHLPKAQEIHFVGYSMGNLVVRQYLAEMAARGKVDRRIGRFVMLGPPNQGADLAKRMNDWPLFHWVVRGSGRQLAEGGANFNRLLGAPPCEFGIVAGGKGDAEGYSPLLAGDDDFIVRVEETKLAGARDFLVTPVVHMFMLSDRRVHEHALRFVRRGYFISEARRSPLPAAVVVEP